jgi:ankyrin repeat protein
MLELNYSDRIDKDSCRGGEKNATELLLEEHSSRGQMEAAISAVTHDLRSIQATAFDTILEYIPCPVDLFVEACFRRYERSVKVGLDQGTSPNVIDSEGRPALHLATIRASAAVTNLLLAYGADPTVRYPLYGTPLMAALEGNAVKRVSIATLPECGQEHALSITGQTDRHLDLVLTVSELSYTQFEHTEEIVRLLLEKDAKPDHTPGTLVSTLTFTAFLGSRNIFDMLLQNGASLDTMDGYLHSPLSASIRGNNLGMAKHILALNASRISGDSAEGHALQTAVERTSVPAVKLLLRHGISPYSKNEQGKSLLHVSVSKLARSIKSARRLFGHIDPSHEQTIFHLLFEAGPQASITDVILYAASQIKDEETRTKVLQKMLPKGESHYFPDEAFRLLIKASHGGDQDGGEFVDKLLDEKHIRHITTPMLAVAESPKMVTTLLDFDPTYKITAGTLDAALDHARFHARKVVKLLLKRGESFKPSNFNVLAVLKQLDNDRSRKLPQHQEMHSFGYDILAQLPAACHKRHVHCRATCRRLESPAS